MRIRRGYVWVALLVGLSGCTRTAAPIADTGSRSAVQKYCDAVVRCDWKTAYATLHSDSTAKWSAEQFRLAAEGYRRKFGFVPETVHIRSCEEHDTQAIAHVNFKGHSTTKHQLYTDGLVLRHTAEGWRVILPHNFGK